jgi:hypothetical protein
MKPEEHMKAKHNKRGKIYLDKRSFIGGGVVLGSVCVSVSGRVCVAVRVCGCFFFVKRNPHR